MAYRQADSVRWCGAVYCMSCQQEFGRAQPHGNWGTVPGRRFLVSFEETLRRSVADISAESGLDNDRAFAVWYCETSLRLERDEAVDACRYDGGNDRGIDIFYVDNELQRVVIAQAKYFKSSTKSPKPADVALLLDALDALSDPQALRDDGRPDLAEAADDLRDARDLGYVVHLQVVYPGPGRKGLESQMRTFNRLHSDEDAAAELVPLAELESLYAEFLGQVGRVAAGTLELQATMAYEQAGTYGSALVCSIPGSSLKALYDLHGNRLFDQNVRLFLGSRKGSVNAGIRETIDDAGDRQNFWAYNNGITIVARSFKRNRSKRAVELKDFSIVNGCQTTVLIGSSDPGFVAGISVLARIVAAPQAIVDSIIRFTNSQTPIRIWEMSARDRNQRRIRSELDRLPEPWFYAFRRGEFDTTPDKTRYGTPTRLLPFPDSIQFLAAFRGLPVQAYKDKGRLFTTHRDKVMPPGLSPVDLLWAWHVGLAVRRLLPTVQAELSDDPIAALVLRRGAQFYATAVAARVLSEQNGADFTAAVDPKRLTDKAMSDRLDKYARTALVGVVKTMKQLLKSESDLGVVLRSPDTNVALDDWAREELVSLRAAPKALEEMLPRLPGLEKKVAPGGKLGSARS